MTYKDKMFEYDRLVVDRRGQLRIENRVLEYLLLVDIVEEIEPGILFFNTSSEIGVREYDMYFEDNFTDFMKSQGCDEQLVKSSFNDLFGEK